MDLSLSDIRSIGVLAGAGMLLGGVYGVVNTFLRESTGTVHFDPKVEALHINRPMHSLYHELSDFRSYSEKDFRQSVKSADELTLRQTQIAGKRILPSLDDSKDAYALYSNASKSIGKMKAQALLGNPRAAAKIERLHKKIHALLQESFMAINKAVRN
jgi:hypothetical protein